MGENMKRLIFLILSILLLLIISTPLCATTIFYNVSNTGGNTWEFSYTVKNDSLSVDIEAFSIFFDYGLYENIAVTGVADDWEADGVEPDDIYGYEDDGYYDAWTYDAAIAVDQSLSGFSVSFDWLGDANETPGVQYFEIYDVDYSVLDEGYTQLADQGGSDPVPEPSTLILFATGLLGYLLSRRRVS